MNALIFDVDSTLCHLRTDYDLLRKALTEKFGGLSFRPLFPTLRTLPEKDRSTALRMVEDAEIKGAENAVALPYVAQALPLLSRNFKLAAYSSNSTRAVHLAFERLHFSRYFDFVIGRNGENDVKPNPRFILAALDALHVQPSEALVVGDHEVDAQSAKMAGVSCSLVATGIRSKEELTPAKPDRGTYRDFEQFVKEALVP